MDKPKEENFLYQNNKNSLSDKESKENSSNRNADKSSISQEDQEAVPTDNNPGHPKNVNNTSGISKKNGYMKDGKPNLRSSRAEIEKIEKDNVEELKNSKPKTDRKDSQHGASGNNFEAGSIESKNNSKNHNKN